MGLYRRGDCYRNFAMREAGKGSKPRPYSVSQETFEANFERIFGKEKASERGKSENDPGISGGSDDQRDQTNRGDVPAS